MQVIFPITISKRENGTRYDFLVSFAIVMSVNSSRFHTISSSHFNFFSQTQSTIQSNSFVKALTILSFKLVPVVTTLPTAQSFIPDFSAKYRLTNNYTSQNKALDLINNSTRQPKIHIVNLGSYAGQFWRFTERAPGKYYLWTHWYGPGKCLDMINAKGIASTSVHLADKGDYDGWY